MNNKLQILNKTFENKRVRTVWNPDEEKYYISVVDIVEILTESSNPRHYWNVLKSRLKEEGNETVTNCDQLKLLAKDGKYRLTDVVDLEGMFRIIESVPSKNAEPIKQWLARLGKEHKPHGLKQNKEIAIMGGNTAKVARIDLENKLRKAVITTDNSLSYKYIEKDKLIDKNRKEKL